jgi:hypothetical protein
LVSFLPVSLRGEVHPNPYQALSDALQPFVNLMVSQPTSPERAARCTLRLVEMTGVQENLADLRVEAAVQYPDRWLLRGALLGEPSAVCRVGQRVWVMPGKKVEFLISQAKDLPPADPSFRLGPFAPPIPEKQLVWFPVLFKITGDTSEDLDGIRCRVLEFSLAPELARPLKAEGWRVRLWIAPSSLPVQIAVAREDWRCVVRFEGLEFAPRLPDAHWSPPASPEADILWLEGPKIKQLLDWGAAELSGSGKKKPARKE